ncbi:M20/M25/M40 family metallo-hydrolase [Aureibaculum sp. 2210JD6-5]|uniref:M20/M25/M40 family metallo-hydrolase n=1 Tax=Aureibaculum sp. 2210JD6-5 TaxID=3103957 RepID=UPI002AAEBD30|nr:M20/M25/M40 family metallo-hydrolase [Aureibaculum sp. 2210JD6-5]MDY7393713.1 M20/M25/M40 family metallo-hydrolase [Aureibaculum sp. 2210JD6-5]
MKKLLSLIAISALLVSCGSTKQTTTAAPAKPAMTVEDFAKTITAAELKEALYIYASDEFEGRDTGEPGQKKAVEFLKKHYVDLNIPAALPNNDYFQEVPLEKTGAPEVSISINGKDFKAVDDFVSFAGSNGTLTTDEIVYVGYGIEDEKYSSYKDIDVTGKIVLFKNGEPKDKDGKYIISGTEESTGKWSNMREEFSSKSGIAKEKGAKAALYYNPDIYGMVAQRFGSGRTSIGLKSTEDKEDQMSFMLVNTALAEAIVSNISTNNESKTVKVPVNLSYKSVKEDINSENVVAYIKGSEKPEEYIVISAHLDHVGVQDGKIYNGADDDGSGSVAMLEIAEAFKKAAENGQAPKRSVVFLHVTGEEKGLLGSRYYTDMDPIFPLENTVANLNIDMIGRTDPKREGGDRNYVYLIGSDKLSTELHNISEEVNKKYTNVELDYKFNDENDPNRFYYRSDHYNFAKNNIPVIFYFNGTHDDYHQHTDTPDKIEYDLLENRTRLIFHTAWELANRAERIVVDKATDSE